MNLQVPLMEMLLGCDNYPCCCFKGSRGTTGTSEATDVKEKMRLCYSTLHMLILPERTVPNKRSVYLSLSYTILNRFKGAQSKEDNAELNRLK